MTALAGRNPGKPRVAVCLTSAGLGLLAVVVLADRILSERGLFEEWPPARSLPYVVRSAGLALGSLLTMAGARLLIVAKLAPVAPPPYSHRRAISLATAVSIIVAAGSAVLVVLSPTTLTNLVQEDRLVEWASAVFSFIAGALVLVAAARYRSARHSIDRAAYVVACMVALGAVFLLLGLEEISWFQRVLGVESPDAFAERNAQQEINLHNFATVATGNALYAGGFGFGVLLPFLFADRALPAAFAWLRPLVPSLAVFYSSVAASAVVFLMWNVILIQITFWMSLAAVVLARPTALAAVPGLGLAGVIVVVAVLFLGGGDTMVRDWDDTEIREAIIPFNLVVYGLGLVAVSPASARHARPSS